MAIRPFLKHDLIKLTDRFAATLKKPRKDRYNINRKTRRGKVVICGTHTVGVKWPNRSSLDYYPIAAIEKTDDINPVAILEPEPIELHWNYFDYKNSRAEGKAKLKEARENGWNVGVKDELEFWIAWSAHANAIAVAALIEASERKLADDAPKKKRRVARSCV